VSAIRFYADEGVVPPTGLTEGGFRRCDVRAIARLELVRTLRDLGAGLDDIRRGMVEVDRDGAAARRRAGSTSLTLSTRCHSLVATINGTPAPDPGEAVAVREWMAAALRWETT